MIMFALLISMFSSSLSGVVWQENNNALVLNGEIVGYTFYNDEGNYYDILLKQEDGGFIHQPFIIKEVNNSVLQLFEVWDTDYDVLVYLIRESAGVLVFEDPF